MYNYIEGKIAEVTGSYIVIDNNGIGYQINTPNPYAFNEGDIYKVFVYQLIREDENSLYGFKTQEEKDLVMDACIDVFIHGEKAFDEPIEYFYSTRGGFVSDWHENNLEYVATIGNHKFFKER